MRILLITKFYTHIYIGEKVLQSCVLQRSCLQPYLFRLNRVSESEKIEDFKNHGFIKRKG